MLFIYTTAIVLFIIRRRWVVIWIFIEINSIILVSIIQKNKEEIEARLIYFITQGLRSIIIIYSVMTESLKNDQNIPHLLISLAIIFKLAAFPLMSWILLVGRNLNKIPFILVLVPQKLIPFIIILLLIRGAISFYYYSVIFSLLIGSIIRIGQVNLKILILGSGITHTGWFICCVLFSNPLWLLYFTLYRFFIVVLIIDIKTNISQNATKHFKIKNKELILFLTLIGIPPLILFLPKIIIITLTVNIRIFTILVVIIIRSVLDFFTYFRISHIFFIHKRFEVYWKHYSKKINKTTQILIIIRTIRLAIIIILK